MNQPGPEPAEFVVAAMEPADECYVTVLLRNGRVSQMGGTPARPVLVRSSITGDEWRAMVDDLLERLKDTVDGLSLRCVAEGFDPGMYPADDKEAIDSAEVHALVVAVAPGADQEVRRVVTGLGRRPRRLRRRARHTMKVRDAIKLLADDGWELRRTRGSYRQYGHQTKPGVVTVPGKATDTLHPKTLASILRQAGLEDER